MPSFKYKSDDAATVKAVEDHFSRRARLQEATAQLGAVFGGKGITCTSGTRTRAYGISFANMPRDTPHWTKPSKINQGNLQLRSSAVIPKGTAKEEREIIKTEHARLLELWKANEPESVDADDVWGEIGIKSGMHWLCGGVMFPLNGAAYFELGFQLNATDSIQGSIEITSGEYEAAKGEYKKA